MNLKKLTLSASIIGIILLLILSNTLQPKTKKIDQISTKHLNKKVKVQGQITTLKSFPESDFQIISIKDKTGRIDITTNQILNLKKDQQITVIGTVNEYKGKLQIQAEKIIIHQ